MIEQHLSPQAQSAALAAFAREALEDGQATNLQALGAIPPHDTFVDGAASDAFDQVRPDGRILFEFRLVDDVLVWISEQLVRRAPVRSGKFAASFTLFADGAEVDIVNPPPGADEYIFLNTQPYARKIERGQSPQAPDGVFEAIATIAGRRFGNTASVSFAFRSPRLRYVAGAANRQERRNMRNGAFSQVFAAQKLERETRTPAIIVRPR